MNHTDLFTQSKSATPEGEIDAALARIRETWNESIPRRKFRKWTPARTTAARATLRIWTVAEVVSAVRCYGQAPWQQKSRCWQRIDTWIVSSMATQWCEQAIQEAEDADWQQKAKDARVAERTDTLAEALRVKGEDEALLLAFGLLPAFEQDKIFAEANKEIVLIGGRMMPPRLLHLDTHLVRKHVLMILRRGAAT